MNVSYNQRQRGRAHNPHQVLPAPTRPGPAPWQSSYGLFLAGTEAIEDVKLVAKQFEEKWGLGCLRLKVGAGMREKFDRQRYLYNQAIWNGDLEELRNECRRMCVAYRALDKAAEAGGGVPKPHAQWEAALDDGVVLVVVQDDAAARRVVDDGRRKVVWTMREVACMVDENMAIMMAKVHFPGARIEAFDTATPDPLGRIPTTLAQLDDDLSDMLVDDCPF
jgi:hypothetical protein